MTASRPPNQERPLGAQRLRRRPLGQYRYVRLRWRLLFAMIDGVGAVLFGVGRLLGRLLARCPRCRANLESPKVILLVQLDHFGDAILTTAMLPALRRRYPAASIEVLASPSNREVFEAVPQLDRVHVSCVNRFARGRLARFAWIPAMLWWGWRLRQRKVDLGIDVRGEFSVAVILWLCGAGRRLGWACGGGRFLLTDSPQFVHARPEVESRLALLAELGIRPDATDTCRPRLHPSEEAIKGVGSLISGINRGDSRSFLLVLHVGAGTSAKQWPAEHWRELLGRILVKVEAEVVLAGGGNDRIIAGRILGDRPWPGVVDWTGRLTIAELAALLERADLMVGADSGPAHLAAAVDTPVVALFSGTNDPRQWQPDGRQVTVVRHPVDCSPCHRERCPLADHPCMSRLSAEQVFAEIQRALSSVPRHGHLPSTATVAPIENQLARAVAGAAT